MNKYTEYLRSFVIGSSFPVFFLWFLRVRNIKKKSWTYENYSLINPFYFGMMNMISLYLSKKYKELEWDLRKRLIVIGIISPLLVSTLTTIFNFYSFTNVSQYLMYYLKIFIWHFFTYNFIIYNLENLLK